MKILNPEMDLERFLKDCIDSANRVLLIDYDGTLAPFRAERDKALPYPGVCEVLEAIMRTGRCRLVVISGRSISDLVALLNLERMPELWGCHGWERMMPDGMYITPELEEAVASGFDEAYAWAESEDLEHYCEKKPACLALHWRGLDPELVAEIKGKVEKEWNSLAGKRGLRFLEFDGGIELRPPGRDKGYAVDTVLEESGGDTIAAYLGDDYTDEDAFRALRGRGLSILVNRSLRNTAADIWLKPPSELLEFLNRWAGICGGENE